MDSMWTLYEWRMVQGTLDLLILRTLAPGPGSTIYVVTRDPRHAEHAQREVHLFDGRRRA
jgi:hypothetical protein